MKALFIIQAHAFSRQSATLAKALCEAGHLVIYSLDGDDALRAQYEREVGSHSGCHFCFSGNVTWCGYSQVSAYLNALSIGIRLETPWDVVINISSSCVLVKPPSEMMAFLEAKRKSNIDALIWSFPVQWDVKQAESNTHQVETGWETLERYAGRNISLIVPSTTKSTWERIESSPIVKAERRLSYFSIDNNSRRELLIRPLNLAEFQGRLHYFNSFGMRVGRAWFVLSYQAALRLVTLGWQTPAWGVFSMAFEPDEYLLHNVIVNHFPDINVKADNIHLGYGMTQHLSFEQYVNFREEALSMPEKFFVRKIELPIVELERLSREVWSLR